jgi:hypothetical protein
MARDEEDTVLGDKLEHFAGKGTDLSALQSHIETYLKNDGFTVQSTSSNDQGTVIQAKKGGILRDLVAADRALTIHLNGSADDFTLHFGIGKWLEHAGVAAIEALLLSELFLVVDIADALWNVEIEDKLIADIKKYIG